MMWQFLDLKTSPLMAFLMHTETTRVNHLRWEKWKVPLEVIRIQVGILQVGAEI